MNDVFRLTNEQLDAVRKYVADFDRVPRIRVGMYGEHGVGKMNIIERLNWNALIAQGAVDPYHSPDFNLVTMMGGKAVACEGEKCSPCPNWSVADYGEGEMSLYTIARHCEGCILVYDVGSRASFDAVKSYHRNFLLEPAYCGFPCFPMCPPRRQYRGVMTVIANKIDRPLDEVEVTEEEGRALATSIDANFWQMSAWTGEAVGQQMLLRHIEYLILARLRRDQAAHLDDPAEYAAEGYTLPHVAEVMRHKNQRYWA